MTGKTHRVGGTLGCLVGFSVMYNRGMLVSGVNPMLQLLVMYPFAIYGGVFSDLDHNPNSIPSKDIVSLGVNKVLHLATPIRKLKGDNKLPFPLSIIDARHRSWQTHSDLFLIVLLYLYYKLVHLSPTVNTIILITVLSGFILGVISHIMLDMLTTEGIPSIIKLVIARMCNLKWKSHIGLVPKWSMFATDTAWEHFIRRLMWAMSIVVGIMLIYTISPYRITFNP